MKYSDTYDSKPVVGKETASRIVERMKDPAYVLEKKRKALEQAQKEYDQALLAYISSLPSEPDEDGDCFAYSKDF